MARLGVVLAGVALALLGPATISAEAAPDPTFWDERTAEERRLIVDHFYAATGHAPPYPADATAAASVTQRLYDWTPDHERSVAATAHADVTSHAALTPPKSAWVHRLFPKNGRVAASVAVELRTDYSRKLYADWRANVSSADGGDIALNSVKYWPAGETIDGAATSNGEWLIEGAIENHTFSAVRWWDEPCTFTGFQAPSGTRLRKAATQSLCRHPIQEPPFYAYAAVIANIPFITAGDIFLTDYPRISTYQPAMFTRPSLATPAVGNAESAIAEALERDGTDELRDNLLNALTGVFQPNDGEILAHRFRPILRFDTSEPWRPLNVERFLDETFADDQETSRHRLCPAIVVPGGCEDWRANLAPPSQMLDDQVVEPTVSDIFWPYIDVHGEGDEIENYVSPRLSECVHGSLNDCDEGPTTAMYFHESGPYPEANYRFIDYWQFYRYNKFDGGDHEADWENVVVALPNASVVEDFAWVGMSAHGSHFRYLRSALHCDDDLSDRSCGIETVPSGKDRVVVFVANGSHANYPRRCAAILGGAATCPRPDIVVPGGGAIGVAEKGHDGERPWGANNDSRGLIEMPEWARWRGWWGIRGDASHVKSPGQQGAFDQPFAAECEDMWSSGDFCSPSGGLASASAQADDPCEAWNGPGVVATVCDPVELKASMIEGTIGVVAGPVVTAEGDAVGRFRSSGGVSQIMGSTLEDGERISLDAPLTAGAELLVRIQDGGVVRRARFAATDLPTGRTSLRLAKTTRGAVQLTRPNGKVVKPVSVERVP